MHLIIVDSKYPLISVKICVDFFGLTHLEARAEICQKFRSIFVSSIKKNCFWELLTFKGTVDVFGGEYDHQEDNDLDDDVEIDLHEKSNENEKVSNKKISLFRGTAKKNGVDTFYDEFHGSDVSDDPVVSNIFLS